MICEIIAKSISIAIGGLIGIVIARKYLKKKGVEIS